MDDCKESAWTSKESAWTTVKEPVWGTNDWKEPAREIKNFCSKPCAQY